MRVTQVMEPRSHGERVVRIRGPLQREVQILATITQRMIAERINMRYHLVFWKALRYGHFRIAWEVLRLNFFASTIDIDKSP